MKRIFVALSSTLLSLICISRFAIAQIVVPKLNPLGTGFTVVSCNGDVSASINGDIKNVDQALAELAKWLDGKAYTSGSCHLVFQPINFGADLRLNIPKSYAVEVSSGASLSIDFGGLRLSQAFVATKPLLAVSGAGHVEIANLDLKGDRSVPCLAVGSAGALVKSSELSSCSDGVRVEASDALIGAADAARYDAEKNTIHDNKLGIHVVSGDRNRFGYNSIYNNFSSMADSADDGILIGVGVNEDLARPAVVLDEGSGAALRCEADADGVITKREIIFTVPAAGEMEIYATGEIQDRGYRNKQGRTFIGACEVKADGICPLPSLLLPELAAGSKSCGVKDLYATALFTGTSSTMYLADPFELDRPSTFAPPVSLPAPIVPGMNDGQGGTEVAGIGAGSGDNGETLLASGEPIAPPPPEDAALPPPEQRSGEDEQASAMSGGTGAAAAGKVSCALTRYGAEEAQESPIWLVMIASALSLIISWRRSRLWQK